MITSLNFTNAKILVNLDKVSRIRFDTTPNENGKYKLTITYDDKTQDITECSKQDCENSYNNLLNHWK
jgi:hypothetical protein